MAAPRSRQNAHQSETPLLRILLLKLTRESWFGSARSVNTGRSAGDGRAGGMKVNVGRNSIGGHLIARGAGRR